MRLFLALGVLATAAPAAAQNTLHDIDVAIDNVLHADAPASVYVAVAGSTSFDARRPTEGAEVLVKVGATTVARGLTDAAGTYVGTFRVPKGVRGSTPVVVETKSLHGVEVVSRMVDVRARRVLQIHTDRTLFAPGQTLHWRATVVNAADAHPVADAEVEVVLKDPRGTELWRGKRSTNATGMVGDALPLGADLVLGAYTLEARQGTWTANQALKVRRIEPPPFLVAITPEGDGFRVVARHPYGEPVEGKALVSWSGGGAKGQLDAFGRFEFVSGAKRMTARVTDGAGRTVRSEWVAAGGGAALSVALVPERAAGARYVTVVTARGDALVPAKVTLRSGGRARTLRSQGALRVPVRRGKVTVTARADGETARASVKVKRESKRWIRAERALVAPGEPVVVRGRWPGGQGLVVSLMRYQTPLATAAVTVDRRGRFRGSLLVPPGAFGLAELRVAQSGWRAERAVVGASVFLEPERVDVRLTGATRYRPGQTATVGVEVTDRSGGVAPGVGLAASVVDERSLALEGPRPDLLEILRGVDLSTARAAGIAFVKLLARGDELGRVAALAIVARLPASPARFWLHHTAEKRWRQEARRMSQVEQHAVPKLVTRKGPVGRFVNGKWAYAMPLRGLLPKPLRVTPWGTPVSWTYAVKLAPRLRFREIARRVAHERLEALATRWGSDLTAEQTLLGRGGLTKLMGRSPGHLRTDSWGHGLGVRSRDVGGAKVFDLVAPGPDGRVGSSDDQTRRDVFGRDPTPRVAYGSAGLGSRGFGRGGGGSVAYGRAGLGSIGRPAPVRKRFDETVLWLAGVATDAAGKATLRVPLADSVTGWRVRVDALGPGGGVGRAETRLETFLELQVDARLPRELTMGDHYVVRAVVANHSGRTRSLTMRAAGSGAVEAAVAETVEVPDGATVAVRVPVKALSAGSGTLALELAAEGAVVDRMERKTKVMAPGHLVRLLNTGRFDAGSVAFDFELPKDVAAGTLSGAVRMYRGTLDQARDGLEGMLREPHGCFEQTSSANYPNLLVLKVMEGAGDVEEALRERARKLLGKGYQRLVSYEVDGGGFSWFGKAPANQVLTAYGLMQFVDMTAVYPVDPELVARTRRWLAGMQNSDGSWTPDPSWLHDWSAAQGKVATTAYIAWAMAEAGETGASMERALGFLRGHDRALSKRPYLLALWAAAEAATSGTGTTSTAKATSADALDRLRKAAQETDDGLRFGAGGETLFYARGPGADAQVTALAVHALARRGGGADASEALRWLWSARAPNHGWGSTQGTVLALRAAAAAGGAAPTEGVLQVRVDGQRAGDIDLASPELPSVALPALAAGRHRLEVVGEVGGRMMADLRATWRKNGDPEPVSNGLAVAIEGGGEPVRIGRTVSMRVEVRNLGTTVVPMPTVVVPVPPGFKVDPSSLEGLPVARHEDLGGVVHFYLEKLDPESVVELPYRLEAKAEVNVTQRAARAYAYYDPAVQGLSGQLRLVSRLP